MENLIYLLKQTQQNLKNYLYNYLRSQGIPVISKDGFLYAKGEIPVLLVAHLDTVLKYPPNKIFYNVNEDKIYNSNGALGGDDRCGIYIIMELLKRYKPYILFTEDEEIGCIGALKVVESICKPKVKYIIEFDRKGHNDAVFYDCGNEEFIAYIESFGFVTKLGSCSDIVVLSEAWDIASVNISSGYYNEHTEEEYIKFNQVLSIINRIDYVLNKINSAPYFDYQRIEYIQALEYARYIYKENKPKKLTKKENNKQ